MPVLDQSLLTSVNPAAGTERALAVSHRALQATGRGATRARGPFGRFFHRIFGNRRWTEDPMLKFGGRLASKIGRTFDSAIASPYYYAKTYPKLGKGIDLAKQTLKATSKYTGVRYMTKAAKGVFGSKFGVAGLLLAGAAAMVGVGVMRGAVNQGRDLVYERYMQDQRYSRNILMNSRVGIASGTNRMRRYGSTEGLSNALHKSRHGRGIY